MAEKRQRALMVVGHGSHLHADSAAPVFAHARALRSRALFDEIVPAFWKEEPSLRNALRAVDAHEVVIVPLFISRGYFTEQVLPRELGLDHAEPGCLSTVDGKRVVYTEPVGTHAVMTDVVQQQVQTVVGNDPPPGEATTLVIAGHGTPRNENSAQAIYHQVELLEQTGVYKEVLALFIDEEPHIDSLFDLCRTPNIIVVPYFISEGLHTQKDIPEMLAIAQDSGYDVPARVGDCRLWYSRAVGIDPAIVEVILARARQGTALLDSGGSSPGSEPVAAVAHREFAAWARQQPRRFCQLLVSSLANGAWELRHVADQGRSDLQRYTDPFVAERLARYGDDGRYRPLSAAPTLRRGWTLHLVDDEALRHAIDAFYPAAVVAWYDERSGQLNPTPFSRSAARQSGMYAPVRQATPEQAQRAARACCTDELCMKRVAWDPAPGEPLAAGRGEGEIPCREACGILIGLVRKIVLSERKPSYQLALSTIEMETLQAVVDETSRFSVELAPEGDTSDPTNIRRIRLLLEKLAASQTRSTE